MTTGDRGDEIVALLTELRDLQKQTLANQERAIAAQQVAIGRQKAHLWLYMAVLVLVLPLIAFLGWALFRVAGAYF